MGENGRTRPRSSVRPATRPREEIVSRIYSAKVKRSVSGTHKGIGKKRSNKIRIGFAGANVKARTINKITNKSGREGRRRRGLRRASDRTTEKSRYFSSLFVVYLFTHPTRGEMGPCGKTSRPTPLPLHPSSSFRARLSSCRKKMPLDP